MQPVLTFLLSVTSSFYSKGGITVLLSVTPSFYSKSCMNRFQYTTNVVQNHVFFSIWFFIRMFSCVVNTDRSYRLKMIGIYCEFLYNYIDFELKKVLLPPPREFCRHILSWRKFQAASFKRCLHSVLRGVSLWQPVTYVTVTN